MQLEMNTAVIIQARLGSTRLPGKVLYKVIGKTILEYVIERAGRARSIEETIVATTANSEDSQIANLADKLGARVYRGSEQDVLDRYYQAAKLFRIKHIVRITADCPLIDPKIIDDVVGHYFDTKSDYCSNVIVETFPDGQDVEVFGFDALGDAWKNARLSSEREHVTPYIRKNAGKFKLASFINSVDLSGKRWTLDEEKDFYFIESVLKSLYPANPEFGIEDVLRLLDENPHLEDLNKDIGRNEGYRKSLKEDRAIDIT